MKRGVFIRKETQLSTFQMPALLKSLRTQLIRRRNENLTTDQKSSRLLLAAHFTLWVLLSIVVCKQVLLPAFYAGPAFGISVQTAESDSKQSTLHVLDFPYLLNFVKETMLHQTAAKLDTSAYSPENHIQVTRNWVNNSIKETRYWAGRDFAMPFAYSPTMLCLLAPLVLFPNNIAYCLFNALGLLAIWWMTHPYRCRYGIGLLSLFSPIALACFVLGQTALISGVCLLFIAEKTHDENRIARWNSSLPVGAALWMLTAKPPFAVTALAVLLGLRRWRPLLVAGILTVLSTVIISPFLGADWLSDYLQLISSYDLAHISSVYSWSIRPDTMANLRAILSVDVGIPDDIASQASVIIWLLTIIYLAAGGGRRK
ncbi:MAG: DUF2029 domain-containing protein, partial [Deltaproteobacteria bacterium]|nr:DUF2029 domain-containing protein [Deltaproteobacteria bacterium]